MEESYSNGRSIGSVVLGASLISLSPFLAEFSDLDALTSSFYRLCIGAVALLAIALGRRECFPRRSSLNLCLMAAVAIGLDLVTWNQSVLYIGSGLSTVLANLEIVFLILIGLVVFREKMTARFGLLCGWIAVGTACLIFPLLHENNAHLMGGVFLGLGASLIYSVYLLILKLVGAKDPGSTAAMLGCICLLAAAFLGFWISLVPSSTFILPHWKSFWCVLASGLLGQTLGWILIVNGLKRVSLSLSGLLMLLQPALTFLLDCLLFGRNTALIQIVGCAILLGTVYRITLEEKRRAV